tara:strand:- start:392 stop:610 length:219 start_codon:yes stop_codon:yes gene_type:complete
MGELTMSRGVEISFRDKIRIKSIDDDFVFEIEIGDQIHLLIHSLDEVDYEGNKTYKTIFEEFINKTNGEILK